MLQKIVCIILIQLVWFASYGQDIPIDHHVHVFSPDLVENLKLRQYGSELIQGDLALFTNIDTILSKNKAKRICAISTGYGYRLSYIDPKDEVALQLKEHNFLSSLVNKHPDRVIPFYGVDPLKPYALQLIRRARTFLNFEGIKLHLQASHVDFRKQEHAQSLRKLFEYTGQHQIPIILHLQNHKSDFGRVEVDFFFTHILPTEFKQTIIFAHLGGGGWVTDKSIKVTEAILHHCTSPNIQHNIYFDISAMIIDQYQHLEPTSDAEKISLLGEIGIDRLVFGSDYPLVSSIDFLNQLKRRFKLSKRKWKKLLSNSYPTKK